MKRNETQTDLLNKLSEKIEEELVYENDKVRCYENVFTRIATKDCRKDYKGRELKGHYVLLVELKDTGEQNYVLFNDKAEPVYVNKQFEAICFRINMLKLLQGD